MPIPLFFIGAAAVTGLFGVGKSIKAGMDQSEAEETNTRAQSMIEEAANKIEICRKNCNDALESLGEEKIRVLNKSVKSFTDEFKKLKNVKERKLTGLNENLVLDEKQFEEIEKLQNLAESLAKGVASGTVAGALTAFGAYGAAGALASASTGTAIATLSGAAATNATLAFFGGGSLAVGGLGIAGGTAVLGGLVAGPALAVLGAVIGSKASENLEQAYSNYAKAEAYQEEMDAGAMACIAIRKRATMFRRFLLSMNAVFEPLVYEMTQIIRRRGADFNYFSEEEKKIVYQAWSSAEAIKSILNVPILDGRGELTAISENAIEDIKRKNKSLFF